jgi:hypothetical protein
VLARGLQIMSSGLVDELPDLEAILAGIDPRTRAFFMPWRYVLTGEWAAAEPALRIAVANGPDARLPDMRALLATCLVELGQPEEALAITGGPLPSRTVVDLAIGPTQYRLTRARALAALGRRDEARETLREAHAELVARASQIEDPVLRTRFITRRPDHVGVLTLAREWLGIEAPELGLVRDPSP